MFYCHLDAHSCVSGSQSRQAHVDSRLAGTKKVAKSVAYIDPILTSGMALSKRFLQDSTLCDPVSPAFDYRRKDVEKRETESGARKQKTSSFWINHYSVVEVNYRQRKSI